MIALKLQPKNPHERLIVRCHFSEILDEDFEKRCWLRNEKTLESDELKTTSEHEPDSNDKLLTDKPTDLNENEKAMENLIRGLERISESIKSLDKSFEISDEVQLHALENFRDLLRENSQSKRAHHKHVLWKELKKHRERDEVAKLKKHINYVADYLETTTAYFGGFLYAVMCIQALFYLTLIWMAIRAYTTISNLRLRNFDTTMFFAFAFCEVASVIGLIFPAVMTNEVVDRFVLTITARFCESINPERASRDLEWLRSRNLGWRIGGFRPSYQLLMYIVYYQVALVSGLLGILVTNLD
jgi:hypothetical protein